ncbi:MAG: hypothetical protein EXR69_11105 [Myxococcales bacterium]|nr:hypothetical protein [Myxococcales bacterium]
MLGWLAPLWLCFLNGALAAELLDGWEFEEDDGGCVAEGQTAQWEWGEVTGGPGAAHSGARAWALSLDGGYLNDTVDTLTCPAVDLSTATRPVVQFEQWFDFFAGDAGHVEVDDGSGWRVVSPLYAVVPDLVGQSGSWLTASVDLSGASGPVALRWVVVADASGVGGGWFIDDLRWWDGDPVAPQIDDVDVLGDTDDVMVARAVSATVRDDVGLTSVVLRYVVDGGAAQETVMAADADVWTAALPGGPPDTTVAYQVLARDGENETVSPAVAFRYFLPAPDNLRLDAQRAVGHTLPLAWGPPFGGHIIEGYRVYRDEVLVAEVSTPRADVPVTGGVDSFTVVAVFGEGEGDPSAPLEITASIPTVTALSPAEGWPGDHLHVGLTGAYLLLTDGRVTATLGEGISVGVSIRDVDSAVLDVQIAADAEPGGRDLVIGTPSGVTTALGVFTVLDGDDRPRLNEAELAVWQGDTATLQLTYVGEMATDEPSVDLGPDIVIDSAVAVSGGLTVSCVVSGDAAVGDRAVTVDDGVRIFDGATLTVRNSTTQGTGNGCVSAPHGGLVAAVGAAAALLSRRKRGM